jgi:hypothetical protein
MPPILLTNARDVRLARAHRTGFGHEYSGLTQDDLGGGVMA